MIWPELLYKLTARDLGSPWAQLYYKRLSSTPALVTSQNLTFVPSTSMIFLLLNVMLTSVPGAAQTTVRMRLNHGTPEVTTENLIQICGSEPNTLAPIRGIHEWQGRVFIMPTWPLSCDVTWDAAAANNQSSVSVSGVLIPVGTLIRASP